MVNHVLTSTDRVLLVVGDAGTGKTFAVKDAFSRIHRAIEIIAPGAEASRGVLRNKEGFATADTVTSFLNSPQRQAGVKNGVIWIDEAGQLPIRDLSQLVDIAKDQNARLVLQGDPKQHRSVARDGNMLRVLETYLPVARLKDIRRQTGDYKKAVELLRDGKMGEGLDKLDDLGWVQTVEDNQPLVDAYIEAVETKGKKQEITDRVLAIAPTHAEAKEVTTAIRDALKQKGMLGTEERQVPTLIPLNWTEAEKGDKDRFSDEVIQFHRNGGSFKAGDRIPFSDIKGQKLGKPSTFAVYAKSSIGLSKGDRIRITANGWTADGKHRLDNGSMYTVKGFGDDGSIILDKNWVIGPNFQHFTHGYVTTSHASQGRTVDRVLIAMGSESLSAISAEQFYVSVSRGREKATVYTDVRSTALRDAIQRADGRKSATEMMRPRPKKRSRAFELVQRAKAAWEALRDRTIAATHDLVRHREYGHAR